MANSKIYTFNRFDISRDTSSLTDMTRKISRTLTVSSVKTYQKEEN